MYRAAINMALAITQPNYSGLHRNFSEGKTLTRKHKIHTQPEGKKKWQHGGLRFNILIDTCSPSGVNICSIICERKTYVCSCHTVCCSCQVYKFKQSICVMSMCNFHVNLSNVIELKIIIYLLWQALRRGKHISMPLENHRVSLITYIDSIRDNE